MTSAAHSNALNSRDPSAGKAQMAPRRLNVVVFLFMSAV